ncbi:MAG: DUF465 domain-containing protein, partial [Pseudomonadota bacterium]
MSIEGHLDALKRKHSALESRLSDLMTGPAPDASALAVLKKEKLKLKEEI